MPISYHLRPPPVSTVNFGFLEGLAPTLIVNLVPACHSLERVLFAAGETDCESLRLRPLHIYIEGPVGDIRGACPRRIIGTALIALLLHSIFFWLPAACRACSRPSGQSSWNKPYGFDR